MNSAEREMLDLLKRLRGEHNVRGLKTEFEAEGARLEEVLRQKELCMRADLALTLKIGGCEAVSDMRAAQAVGVDALVAPMIESAFALRKFVDAARSVFSPAELESMELRVNVESAAGAGEYDAMLASERFDALSGIVIGRKDLALSLGSDDVDDPRVAACCREIFRRTRATKPGARCSMGGMISPAALPLLEEFAGMVDSVETRKVIYDLPAEGGAGAGRALLAAAKLGYAFEALWYRNKHAYYQGVADADAGYLKRVEKAEAML